MNKTDFSTNSKLDSNILSVEVLKNSDEDYQYAYYLMKDNIKIEVKWYTNNNSARFELYESGNYHIVCFIKQLEEKVVIETRQYNFQTDTFETSLKKSTRPLKCNISIYGSCVTRDLFELKENTFLNLKSYIARQSILSAVSSPIPCEKDNIKLKSNFQKNVIYNDFVKNTFNLLENDSSDYIIIDLIDERFSLMNYKNSIITVSPYLVESGYFTTIDEMSVIKQPNGQYCYQDINIDTFINLFCKKILEIYDSSNIILHKAIMLDKYIDKQMKIQEFSKNYLENSKKVNGKINYIYNLLEKNLRCGLVVDVCKDYYADENHKWGLAPMHYCNEYYRVVLRKIEDYLTNKIEG